MLAHHPGTPLGFEIPSVLAAVRQHFPTGTVTHSVGCDVEDPDPSGISDAVVAAGRADVAIVVVGDRAGLFGRGTVGEGNDVESLELPGAQRRLIEEVVRTGTPVVLVVLSGRPYALDWAFSGPDAPAAVLQSFFPGEEGANAIAAIVAGTVSPSGRLPVSMPRSAGAQPYTYLHPALGGDSEITSAASAPALPFGHGLTYTSFAHADLRVAAESPTGGMLAVEATVRNTGDRPGADVVQLYVRDEYASVTRPVAQLVAYRRVELEPGEEALVRFEVPPARLAFTDAEMRRVVEPGEMRFWVGSSCDDVESVAQVRLTGEVHRIAPEDEMVVRVSVEQPARVLSA